MLEHVDRQLRLEVALAAAGAEDPNVDVHAELTAWLLAEPLAHADPEQAELLAALGVGQ